MKVPKHVLCLLVILLAGALNVYPQETEQPAPPPKYKLELVYIFEANPTEFIFLVGNVGFKSVDSLKKFVGDLPPGSILEWAPGCLRSGGEPLLSSPQDLEDFKAFCAAKKINFVLVPAG
jgi:fructose-1,6-bisphosphatase